MDFNIKNFLEAIKVVIGPEGANLHEPEFSGNEQRYLIECLNSTFVSSVGPTVEKFEKELAQFVGVKRAIAVSSGTAALQVALKVAGVNDSNEVIVPSLSFVATANAVHYLGAIPHFVDVEETTLGLDPIRLRDRLKKIARVKNGHCVNLNSGRIISAIVPMHTFGHPCNIMDLCEVANEFNLSVIEDAAEALGSYYNGKHMGTYGMLGAVSFNGNKIITSGAGGAVLTNDDELADFAKHISSTARVAHKWEIFHDQIGYNFRMPNLNAALASAQLEQIQKFLVKKRTLYSKYKSALEKVDDVALFQEPPGAKSNYWLQSVLLDPSIKHLKNEILEEANLTGIKLRPVWSLLHNMKQYKDCPRDELTISNSIRTRLINLPSSPGLL